MYICLCQYKEIFTLKFEIQNTGIAEIDAPGYCKQGSTNSE